MIYRYFLLIALLILNNSNSLADMQQRVVEAESDYINNRFLNAVFMFADDNKSLFTGAKGLFALNGEQLKANEVMPIAGATKPMTAVAILKLQDRKLLNVNDTIDKYIDQEMWGDGKTAPAWAHEITIHNLLTHTSGLADYFKVLQLDLKTSRNEINKQILQYAASKPLENAVGKKFQCSNTDFVILGMIIERISKKKLEDFFHDEFFKPLNMKSTNLASFAEAKRIQENVINSNYPIRYYVTPTNDKPIFAPINVDFVAIPYADGGVISTPCDLIKWYRALNQGKLLSKKSYKQMTTKYFLVENKEGHKTYTGYGIYLTQLDSKHLMVHHPGGRAIGIRSEAGYILPDNLYFAILSNVVVKMDEDKKDEISIDNPANQLDIIYFRDAIINAAIKEDIDTDKNTK